MRACSVREAFLAPISRRLKMERQRSAWVSRGLTGRGGSAKGGPTRRGVLIYLSEGRNVHTESC